MLASDTELLTNVLQLPLAAVEQTCAVTVHTFHHLGNLAYQNTAESVFEKLPLGPGQNGPVFRVRLRGFSETNTSGINRLDPDMARLKEELVIETDATGAISRVLNKPQLREKFEELHPALLEQADGIPYLNPTIISNIGQVLVGDGYLEDVLRHSPEYGLLFPGLYGRAYTATPTLAGPRLLPHILGNLDLPLLLEATRTSPVPPDVAYGVYLTGQLDQENFRADDLRQGLRSLLDSFNLNTTLRVRHQESYEFDAAGELCYAGRISDYGVAGVFSTQQVCTLKSAIFT